MPEGDAVLRTARRLHAALAGDVLVRSDLRWPSLATADLRGWTTVEVVARGKHLLHRLSGPGGAAWTLHSHLRMDGSWRILPADRPAPAGHRLRALLASAAAQAAGWSLGMLDLVRTADESRLVGHLGPDLLGPDWDAERAAANLRAAGGLLGPALLDQRNLAGLGTMWAAETLFAQGVHPLAAVTALPDADLAGLLGHARRLITAAAAEGVPGRGGRYRPTVGLAVYGRHRESCPRCGGPVARLWAGPRTEERVFYHCPRCQPPPAAG